MKRLIISSAILFAALFGTGRSVMADHRHPGWHHHHHANFGFSLYYSPYPYYYAPAPYYYSYYPVYYSPYRSYGYFYPRYSYGSGVSFCYSR